MEARTVPRAAPAGVAGFASPRLLRVATDAHLVDLIRQGRGAAFETVYDRHHRAILSFCRHMLGSAEEAEDAVQHTFLSAYNDLIATDRPMHLRAWLFTIARNRCYSMLRARREQPVGDLAEPVTEGLAAQAERRQDLRDLVLDLGRLPDEQRAALVLSEMDSLSHEQIGRVLDVPKDKVKALVFQARESLIASRNARETDCSEIREQLANLRGGALRRANLRRHLRECSGCREFRDEVDTQRRQLRLLLPVVPTIALKEGVLGATSGGTATATAVGGGTIATSIFKGGLIKGLIGAAIAGVGTAGTIVAVHDFQVSSRGANHPARTAAVPRGSAHRAATATVTAASRPTSTGTGTSTVTAAASLSAASVRAASSGRALNRITSSTLVEVLHPLAPAGLVGSKPITSPLIPVVPVAGVSPSQPTLPQPGQSGQPTATGNPPNLGAGTFGTGTQPTPPSSSTPASGTTPTTQSSSTPVTSSSPVTQTGSGTSSSTHGTTTSGGGRYTAPLGSGTPLGGTSTRGGTGSSSPSGSRGTTTTSSSSTSSHTASSSTPTTTTTTTTASSTTQPSGDGGRSGGSGSSGTPTGTTGSTGYGGGSNTGPGGR